MEKINVIIERAKDGTFGAYGETVEGIYGMGDTIEEVKKSAIKGAKLFVSYNQKKNLPKELQGDYTLVFSYDTESLLKYYKGIFTNSAFERLTGINQKQIQHYASGLRKPRRAQAKKIETALHKLGSELLAIEL